MGLWSRSRACCWQCLSRGRLLTLKRRRILNRLELRPHVVFPGPDFASLSVGHCDHCAHVLHKAIEVRSTIRFSFAHYNTAEDADVAVGAMEEFARMVRE